MVVKSMVFAAVARMRLRTTENVGLALILAKSFVDSTWVDVIGAPNTSSLVGVEIIAAQMHVQAMFLT